MPGAARAAQAAPDGYTLLVTGGSHVNNPFLYSHVPYDPLKDFDAVTLADRLRGCAHGASVGAGADRSRNWSR